jgi:quinol monooxygenase YgiN
MNTNKTPATRTVLVRYKTSAAHADANATLVRAVFDELRASTPTGLRYATYRLADGVTFVHLATLANPDENPLLSLPAFKAFQERLKDRCVEPPVVAELSPVDSYGFVA